MSSAGPEGQARRCADAVRNRALVLRAAREVLGEEGIDAAMEAVARRAGVGVGVGVGVGTVYRHFANKDALVAAVVVDLVDELRPAAAAARAMPDAWAGFEAFVWRVAELHATHRITSEVKASAGMPDVTVAMAWMREELLHLLARAGQDGALRAGIDIADLPGLLAAAGRVSTEDRPGTWRRRLEIVLAGTRRP